MNDDRNHVNLEDLDSRQRITTFETPACICCNEGTSFTLTTAEWVRWKHDREPIQQVFPHLAAEQREWMISGIHPECWTELFG